MHIIKKQNFHAEYIKNYKLIIRNNLTEKWGKGLKRAMHKEAKLELPINKDVQFHYEFRKCKIK